MFPFYLDSYAPSPNGYLHCTYAPYIKWALTVKNEKYILTQKVNI